MITLAELQQALEVHGQHLKTEEVQQILANVSTTGTGKINYSDFLVATVELQSVLTKDRLMALFKYFDTD